MPKQPKVRLDPELVASRQAQLESARVGLQRHFIGIDSIIDELVEAVRIWYVAPELLARPVIVNLWGMTGVGKTDLVRRMVQALDIGDRFVEIELTNNDQTTMHTSVASRLAQSGALEGRPTLLLFDEIQRFNTLDHEGKPVTGTKFSDFWELLSDGRIVLRESPDLPWLLASLSYSADEAARTRAKDPSVEPDTIGIWEAQNLKRTARLDDEIEHLAQLSYAQALHLARRARQSKQVFEPLDCTKCLVIISGNLDEAFTMATEGAEADVDADLFATYTDKVTVVDVKSALTRRFKPEQVARFGNTHLIYTSLRRRDFENLIKREVDRVRAMAKANFGVRVRVDSSVHALIYRNGVFPVQGVRPVFSSVADILENNLAKLLFDAFVNGVTAISLRYDEANQALIGTVGEESRTLPYTGRIDKIRQSSPPDKVANIAVHEAGHAVMYALQFGLAPLQLTARVASTYVGGFTSPHPVYETADTIIRQAKVALAGGIAEEIVFGRELASIGRESDRAKATELVIDFVRRHGFDREFQANYMLGNEYAMDRSVPEPDIEKMVTRLTAEARGELNAHRDTLLALARRLSAEGLLDAATVSKILDERGIPAEVRSEEHVHLSAYRQLLHGSADDSAS
ncbi:MAG: hypothetical protein ACRCYQ_13690 [Nocardioides sp.]